MKSNAERNAEAGDVADAEVVEVDLANVGRSTPVTARWSTDQHGPPPSVCPVAECPLGAYTGQWRASDCIAASFLETVPVLPLPSTGAALTEWASHPCVLGSELVAVDAMCLSRFRSSQRVAPYEVLPASHRLQVARIDATPVTAKMVEVGLHGDVADHDSVQHPVGEPP